MKSIISISLIFPEMVKRFKPSPFAWTNALSGYQLVLIPEGPLNKAEKFRLKLVKDPMWASFFGNNNAFRKEYVVKLMNKNNEETPRQKR